MLAPSLSVQYRLEPWESDYVYNLLKTLIIDFVIDLVTETDRHAPERVDEECVKVNLHYSQSSILRPRLLSKGSAVSNGKETVANPEKSSPATSIDQHIHRRTSPSARSIPPAINTATIPATWAATRPLGPPATPRQVPADASTALRAKLQALLTEIGIEQRF